MSTPINYPSAIRVGDAECLTPPLDVLRKWLADKLHDADPMIREAAVKGIGMGIALTIARRAR